MLVITPYVLFTISIFGETYMTLISFEGQDMLGLLWDN